MTRPYTTKDTLHRDQALSVVIQKEGGEYYFSIIAIRPSTVTIYNVATAGAGWTEIAAGLTGVLSWKLTEELGTEFDYAFVAAPATYMTSYGDLQRDTALTALYVRRRGGVDINLQLEVWAK